MDTNFLRDLETFIAKIRPYFDNKNEAGQALTACLKKDLHKAALGPSQRTLIKAYATPTAGQDFEKATEGGNAGDWVNNLAHCFRDGGAKAIDAVSMVAGMEREEEGGFPGAPRMLCKTLAKLDLILHDISHNYTLFLSPVDSGEGDALRDFMAAIADIRPELAALQARLVAEEGMTPEAVDEITREIHENYGQGIDHIKEIPVAEWASPSL